MENKTQPSRDAQAIGQLGRASHAARDRGIITAKQSRDVRVRPSLAKADLSAKNNLRIRRTMPFLGATSEVGEAFQPGGLSRQVKVRQDEFSCSSQSVNEFPDNPLDSLTLRVRLLDGDTAAEIAKRFVRCSRIACRLSPHVLELLAARRRASGRS